VEPWPKVLSFKIFNKYRLLKIQCAEPKKAMLTAITRIFWGGLLKSFYQLTDVLYILTSA